MAERPSAPKKTPRPRVVRLIARLNVGGPARHVAWLNSGLNSEFDSTLLVGSISPGEDDMADFAASLGVEPVLIPGLSREISFSDLSATWRIYRMLVRLKPDIVHTHTAKAGTVGRPAAMLYRWLTPSTFIGRPRACRLVHTYHGHVFHSYFGRWKTRLILLIEQLLAKVTDRIVVISDRQLTEIRSLVNPGSQQFSVIPLGIDLSAFADSQQRRQILRDEVKAADDDLLVGIVGRLVDVKNHELFLNAVATFKTSYASRLTRKVRFLVIGDGPLREQLVRQTKQLGLDQDVLFLGMRPDPEVFYPGLDIVMLTSKNEGTPLSLIEAMANGRPVLSTAVGGVIDLLDRNGVRSQKPERPTGCSDDRNGVRSHKPERPTGCLALMTPDPLSVGCSILLTPDPLSTTTIHAHGISALENADSLAAGIFQLASNEQLRVELGTQGHAFVHQAHSKERLIGDIRQLYRSLLNGGNWVPKTPYAPSQGEKVAVRPDAGVPKNSASQDSVTHHFTHPPQRGRGAGCFA